MKVPKKLAEQSMVQQEAFIHRQVQDTQNVIFTDHARKRMKERMITATSVIEVPRYGRMVRPAEANIKTGYLECRLNRNVNGQEIGVVAAIDDDDPSVIVVTAMN